MRVLIYQSYTKNTQGDIHTYMYYYYPRIIISTDILYLTLPSIRVYEAYFKVFVSYLDSCNNISGIYRMVFTLY